jgi:hypothetical protein
MSSFSKVGFLVFGVFSIGCVTPIISDGGSGGGAPLGGGQPFFDAGSTGGGQAGGSTVDAGFDDAGQAGGNASLDAGGGSGFDAGIIDSDNDGVSDDVDNCPSDSNSNQDDIDADGKGDVCDSCDRRDFGQIVVLPSGATTLVRQAVMNDLLPQLAAVRRLPFQLLSQNSVACAPDFTGIYLVHSNELSAFNAPTRVQTGAQLLGISSPDSYLIDAQNGSVWVVAKNDRALIHGLYEVLEQVGVKFLLPGPEWIVAPPKMPMAFTLQALRKPSFQTVQYFGAGGWGPVSSNYGIPLVGADGTHAKNQKDWLRQNRFPQQFVLGGHSWEAFVADPTERAVLTADPTSRACLLCNPELTAEYAACIARPVDTLCGDRGSNKFRRTNLSGGGAQAAALNPSHHGKTVCQTANTLRPCNAGEAPTHESLTDFSTNGGLAQRFADWTLARVAAQVAAAGGDTSTEIVVSVDPADGEEYCQCDKCLNMLRNGAEGVNAAKDASGTDGVTHLANHAARRVKAVYPNAKLSMYAYAYHAEVPTLPIESSIKVMLVPYAFQQYNTGLRAEEFIESWRLKAQSNAGLVLGIRDYWSTVTSLGEDQPTMSMKTAENKLAAWRTLGAQFFLNESTYSSGAAGMHWYETAHAVWDPSIQVNTHVSQWFVDAFGPAAAPIENMYRRFWNRGWDLNALELNAAFSALAQAETLVGNNPQLKKRLLSFEIYIEYLRLKYEYKWASMQAKDAAFDALMTHIWRAAPTGMMHSYWLWYQLMNAEASPVRWRITSANTVRGAAWNNPQLLVPITESEMNARVASGLIAYPSLGLVPAENTYVGSLIPLQTPVADGGISATDQGYFNIFSSDYVFHMAANQTVNFELNIRGNTRALRPGTLTFEGPTGFQASAPRKFLIPNTSVSVAYPVAFTSSVAGEYRMHYEATFNEEVMIKYPKFLPLARVAPAYFNLWVEPLRHWFYVPIGTRKFAYNTNCHEINPALYPTTLYLPNGSVAVTSWIGNLATVTVPPAQDGSIWSIGGYCHDAKFENLPNFLSYERSQVLKPNDAP